MDGLELQVNPSPSPVLYIGTQYFKIEYGLGPTVYVSNSFCVIFLYHNPGIFEAYALAPIANTSIIKPQTVVNSLSWKV